MCSLELLALSSIILALLSSSVSRHLKSSSIKNLFNLVHLDLSSNSFTGMIPPSLNQLEALSYLDLSSNHFNGTIPPTISRLFNLKSLLLSSNLLTGSTSLSFLENITTLEQLVLSHNQLTVNIPSTWIPKFEKLSGLGLASCGLDKFPPFLSRQYHMFCRNYSNNNMGVSHLNISSSELSGRLPLKIVAKNLGFLDLQTAQQQFGGFSSSATWWHFIS